MQAVIKPGDLVGTTRRFGSFGPVYQISALVEETETDAIMRIVVPSTGETLDYPFSKILDDPKEA